MAILKCPHTLDFVDALPREATGKIFKARIRERYWPQKSAPGASISGPAR